MNEPSEDQIVCAFLVRDGRALLVHRAAERVRRPNVWDAPGGHIDAGETAAQGLVREIKEELGVDIAPPAGEPALRTRVGDTDVSVWIVDEWTGDPRNAAPDEHDAIGWFGLAEITDLNIVSDAHRRLLERLLG